LIWLGQADSVGREATVVETRLLSFGVGRAFDRSKVESMFVFLNEIEKGCDNISGITEQHQQIIDTCTNLDF
jgi:hypothetical protein